MEFNPYKVYNRFIQEAHIYKESMMLAEEYATYQSFLRSISEVIVFQGNKPRSDVAYKKATSEKRISTQKGGNSNLSRRIDRYTKDHIYHSDDLKLSPKVESTIKTLRQLTSLRVMSFNSRAGVKNIIKGLTDIFAEGKASQYVDSKSLRKGFADYRHAIGDMITDREFDEASSLASAFIRNHPTLLEKQNEKGVTIENDVKNIMDRVLISADAAYFFNNVGEHIMQYGMYISMLHAHRIVNGKIVNQSDYISNFAQDLLMEELPAEILADFKEYVKSKVEENIRPFEHKDYFSTWLIQSTVLKSNPAVLKNIKDKNNNKYKVKLNSKIKEFNS